MSSSQPSISPIGRLPTSPRNSFATGLLNGAKPSIAPRSEAASSAGRRSAAPVDAEKHDRGADRHDFGDRHPVDAVHEIDQVDEPDQSDEQAGALQPLRNLRDDVEVGGQRHQHRDGGQALQHQPRQRPAGRGYRRPRRRPRAAARQRSASEKVRTGAAGPRAAPIRRSRPRCSVAATTAMPPPCGVGSLCEERAFGRASA